LNIRLSFLSRFLGFCFVLLAGASCKENTILGTNVLPTGDSLSTITIPDTFTVQARTVYDDSIVTEFQKLISGTALVVGTAYMTAGVISTDPFFGKTVAALAFEPAPVTANFTFGNNPRIDSAVLVLPYSGFSWGDTLSAPAIRYRAYRLSQALSGTDSLLYSFRVPSVDRSVVFGEQTTYLADLRDSVAVGGIKRPPHLRIKLDLGTFLPALQQGIDASATLRGFAAALRGIYVEPASVSGSILPYFSFLNGTDLYQKAGVVVYYKNDGGDSLTASFPFQSSAGKAYTYIRRDYAGTPAYNYITGTGGNPNLVLLQNEPGAAIDIQMPYVKNLPKTIYNRAQLIITAIDTASSDQYFIPARIFPQRVETNGATVSIADRLPEGSAESANFVDGKLRRAVMGGVTVNQYVINFPRELQRAVNSGRDVLHLRLNGVPGFPGAYRLIAGSRSHPQYGIKLVISYSRI
jgi:hypothetical protein